ncbi:MAG: hypothetical protein HOW73_44665 [Polyangiaceae bacterium]|nr:hypothetical protein [Polyangiaceae bacterium]
MRMAKKKSVVKRATTKPKTLALKSKEPAQSKAELNAIIGSAERRARLVELMREEIHFTDEAIARFAQHRVQIDADY